MLKKWFLFNTTFVNIVELKSANSEGVLNAILSALADLQFDKESLKHDTDGGQNLYVQILMGHQ